MDFLKKHCGTIIITLVGIALFVLTAIFVFIPSLKSGPIGDTIGGTTAPFWGFLSVILLYLTLKEQQDFNKAQRTADEYKSLIGLRANIEILSNTVFIPIINSGTKTSYQGTSYIEVLRKSANPNNSIQENNFDKLYKDVIAIATLCTLYSNILGQSSLNTETKIVFSNVIKIHAENAWRLFVLYKDQNINIINASSDIWERYVKNEELEAKLKDIIKE